MKRCWLPAAAALGIGLFAWTIYSVGPAVLLSQMRALAPVLPLILVLAGLRFWFQAAGWRLAMPPDQRPSWPAVYTAVVAGEAAGYFAWGPVSREPMKAMLVADRVPQRTALKAAVFERFMYTIPATLLIVAGIGIAAVRFHFVGWFVLGSTAALAAAFAAGSYWRRVGGDLRRHRASLISMAVLAAAQETSNVIEAYLVLAWLGASPAVTAVVVLEGLSRLMNSAGQFIPGKLGVTEAATTALAQGLSLGGSHGLSLALARRVRSLAWGALGIAFVTLRAINWQGLTHDTIRSLRVRGSRFSVPARGLLH
jgi:lysylphosphatidylglycerol synthase-like protein